MPIMILQVTRPSPRQEGKASATHQAGAFGKSLASRLAVIRSGPRASLSSGYHPAPLQLPVSCDSSCLPSAARGAVGYTQGRAGRLRPSQGHPSLHLPHSAVSPVATCT